MNLPDLLDEPGLSSAWDRSRFSDKAIPDLSLRDG
jgi:hypothetical protein